MDNLDVAYAIAERAIRRVFAWHAIITLRRGRLINFNSSGWAENLPEFHIVEHDGVKISPKTLTLELLKKFDLIALRDVLTIYHTRTPSQWSLHTIKDEQWYTDGTTLTFDYRGTLPAAIEYVEKRIAEMSVSEDTTNHFDLIKRNNELAAELAETKKQLAMIRGTLDGIIG